MKWWMPKTRIDDGISKIFKYMHGKYKIEVDQ